MATRTISTKLAVEGESEYKSAISNCNTQLATLKSALALVESEFTGNKNSMEALTSKGTALSDMYDGQKAKVAALEDALKNAQTAQETYADRVATAQTNIQQYEEALEGLKDSTGDTSQEQEALTKELEKWNEELVEAQAYQEAAERGVENWQKQLNYANTDLNKLNDQIDLNNQYLEEAAESADGCATSIDEFGKSSEESADKAGEAISVLASALAAAGIAASMKEIAEALMECSSAAATFETAMAKIETVADTTAISMDEIESQIISLSSSTGIATASLAEATYSAISAGVDTAESVAFVAQATELAMGGFTETETAVDVLTTALNAYNLSVEDTQRVSDVLINTQNLGKTTVDELSSSVGTVIPLASAYGVEIENLGAAYATLTANGVETQTAGTYLKNMLSELGDSASTVSLVLQEQTGKSFADLMDDGYSLGDVLDILGESVDGSATGFSELWSSTEAGTGALSIFNAGAEGFNETLASMENCAGATTQAYETMADTTENSQQRMQTAMENLQIAIGQQLNPALENLYDTGADAFSWATDFITDHPDVVAAFVAVATGVGTLAIGVAGVASASQIATIATAAWNAVLAANPVGLVAVAVVGLTTAIVAYNVITSAADEETQALIDSLKETKEAYDGLVASIESQNTATETLINTLKSALEVEEKSEAQKSAILSLVDQLNEAIPDLGLSYDGVTDSINMTTGAIEGFMDSAVAQEEYAAQVERLSELYVEQEEIAAQLAEAQGELDAANQKSDETVKGAGEGLVYYWSRTKDVKEEVSAAEEKVNLLTEAYEDNAEQALALEEATATLEETQTVQKETSAEAIDILKDVSEQMGILQTAYDETYTTALESIEGQISLFQEMDGSAQTSIESLIETLSGQVDYMYTYADNIAKAMELGVDQGLIQQLSDGSEESAQILAAIVEGGEEDITALNEQLARVEEGKTVFASAVADMETDFSNQMTALESRLDETVEALDVSLEAGAAGINSILGYIEGAESMRSQLISTYSSLATAANDAYKGALMIQSPSKVFYSDGENSMEGAIDGGESKREELERTYERLALSAHKAYENALPSTTEEPNTTAIQSAQTDSILRAISGNQGGSGDTNIYITSTEALTEKSAAREFKKAARDLSLGVS